VTPAAVAGVGGGANLNGSEAVESAAAGDHDDEPVESYKDEETESEGHLSSKEGDWESGSEWSGTSSESEEEEEGEGFRISTKVVRERLGAPEGKRRRVSMTSQ
ncbi:unnamed protein product, partial [Discosporangium mesarthrocarpum]